MTETSPFESIFDLEPLEADLAPTEASELSYSDIVDESSGWLPDEVLDAFATLEGEGFDVADLARNLSVILALARGELRSKASIRRWFSTGQVETSQGQVVYLSSIGKLAREIQRISKRIAEANTLEKEKAAEFRDSSGKKQERLGAALDRLEESTRILESKRRKAASEFEQFINLVADYLGVGGMK